MRHCTVERGTPVGVHRILGTVAGAVLVNPKRFDMLDLWDLIGILWYFMEFMLVFPRKMEMS
jgi:hypothetical protein